VVFVGRDLPRLAKRVAPSAVVETKVSILLEFVLVGWFCMILICLLENCNLKPSQ